MLAGRPRPAAYIPDSLPATAGTPDVGLDEWGVMSWCSSMTEALQNCFETELGSAEKQEPEVILIVQEELEKVRAIAAS